MDISVDTLLKLLSEFAITSIFCGLGAWIQAIAKSSKSRKKIDFKEIIASVVFSTSLMCSCAQYLSFTSELYALVSMICGMWGKNFINLLVNEKFIQNFFNNITKVITAPFVKEVVRTAAEVMESEDKAKSKKSNKNKEESKQEENQDSSDK